MQKVLSSMVEQDMVMMHDKQFHNNDDNNYNDNSNRCR